MGSRPGRFGIAVLLKGEKGDYLGGSSCSPRVRDAVYSLFPQDRLCIFKSHILREVTLLHRTQWI